MRRMTGGRFLVFIAMPLLLATVSAMNLCFDLLNRLEDSVPLALADTRLANILVAEAWAKTSAVIGFLVVVMTGIGVVCWKLVQQIEQDEQKAQHKALHDHLTGLSNRLALVNEMQALQDRNVPYAVAFADLDGFKEVNDSYGHEYGDQLIFMIANGIRQLAEKATLCARLGGDEFIVLFEGAEGEQRACDFSNNLVGMLQQPFDMDGRLASVGASVGIATQSAAFDVNEMLRRSDIAMYKAKASGRNRHCVFEESFDIERNENLAIAAELKAHIASQSLEVAFQPFVNARSGAITGAETLVRWPSSAEREVSAEKFVTIAENAGLIDSLGELVLDKACRAAAQWPGLRLAVNISPLQFNNPAFVSNSLATLRRHGIDANRMEFEITETSLIQDAPRAQGVFKALQRAGVKVALDDFGSGFSSIGYLRKFQFDRIKIDKSIVSEVLSSASELAVVQGTLLVARGLSAEVTAEGVQSDEHAKVLRLAGCTEFQGFHYYRPMTDTELTAALQKRGFDSVPRTVIVA